MRQRVMLAMALALRPELLIADEPTTALDVTVQAQLLDLLARLQREHGTAVVLVTHDLGVVAQVADRVLTMYAGRIVEEATDGRDVRRPPPPVHPWPAELHPRGDDARDVAACRSPASRRACCGCRPAARSRRDARTSRTAAARRSRRCASSAAATGRSACCRSTRRRDRVGWHRRAGRHDDRYRAVDGDETACCCASTGSSSTSPGGGAGCSARLR